MSYENDNFIIEFHTIGGSVKVTAFDPVTLTEAVIIGPTKATQKQLTDLAVKKLLYVLNKEQP